MPGGEIDEECVTLEKDSGIVVQRRINQDIH